MNIEDELKVILSDSCKILVHSKCFKLNKPHPELHTHLNNRGYFVTWSSVTFLWLRIFENDSYTLLTDEFNLNV